MNKTLENMRSTAWLTVVTLLLVTVLPVTVAAANNSDQWEYEAIIYMWGAGMDGNTQTGGDFDVSFSDILGDLDMAFMGTFGAHNGKWSLLADVIYLDISQSDSGDETIPILGGASNVTRTVDLDVGMKSLITTFGVGYNIVDNKKVALDLIGGARYFWIKADAKLDLTLNGMRLQTSRQEKISESKHIWDGIIGVRGKVNLNNNWYLPYYADIGTGDSQTTWQAMVGVGYNFKWGDMLLAYRYLDYEFDSDFIIEELTVSGPALGARLRF